jgi:hypothetical protein
MYCGGCDNIPFWRWLRKQTTTSVTCNDYNGKSLSNLQLSNITGCFREYLCTSFWKCYQIYRKYIKNIDPFFYEEEFEDTKEVIRRCKSKDKQHKGQKKRDKRTNTDQKKRKKKTIEITKDRATRTPLKTEDELRCSRKVQVLVHMWHLSCYSCYTPGDKWWMRKGKYKGYIPFHEATFIFTNLLPFYIL